MSLYRVIRLIGSSSNSWEEAAKSALEEAAKHLEEQPASRGSCSVTSAQSSLAGLASPHANGKMRRALLDFPAIDVGVW